VFDRLLPTLRVGQEELDRGRIGSRRGGQRIDGIDVGTDYWHVLNSTTGI
jgi:hypothetical protein